MSSGYLAKSSFAQRQLCLLDLLQPGRAGYAVPLVIEITGPADPDALRQAIDAVIGRHDVLRASFPLVDDVPALAVNDDLAVTIPLTNVTAATQPEFRQRLDEAAARVAEQPMPLATGPLIAAEIVRAADADTADGRLGLVVIFHHAVADGASLALFVDDLVTAYDAIRAGKALDWPELPLQYPDYADWEQDRFGEPDAPALVEPLRYWRETLRDVPPLLDLPLDRRRGATARASAAATARLELPGAIGTALAAAAQRRGTTPFLAFLTVFFIVLQRWSGLNDLLVTVPVSKRTRPELAKLIGLFVDTLPLRLACDPEARFDALLDTVHRIFLDAVRHRDVPFQRIVQGIDIERHADVVPLMQVLFGSLEADDAPRVARDGSRFLVVDDRLELPAKADLSLVYRQTASRVELWCRYDPALFDRTTIDNLLTWFGAVAAAVTEFPERAIADLPLIDETAGRALIARFNETARPYPSDRSVPDVFVELARKHPDQPAVDEGGQVTTYAALEAQSAQLAAALAAAGVGPGDTVVLVVPLSARFIALVLAILRLGASYVPVDPANPPAYRTQLITLLGARAIIVPADDDSLYQCQTLQDEALAAQAATRDPAPMPHIAANDVAYVMFTSGSTGTPKGVAVPHRAILRLVCNTDFAAFGPQTRAAVYSNPSFDASTLELWAPLLNGGTAVIVERRAMLDAATLRRVLSERDITLLWITAGLFHEIAGLDPAIFAGPRLVITGGDVVNPATARTVLEAGAGSGLRLLDGYGPTENTTFSTTFDLADLDAEAVSIPIGRPIANSTVYILDRGGRPLPAGVIGEIHVGGDGVAVGYVGDPERTASKFLPDPFDARANARMYKTGDFGRWRADGTVLFAGRSDDQVKVRGYRIELDEIATTLARHPALRSVHVAAPRQAGGERLLVAYVVARQHPGPSTAELRAFLEPLLPPQMLPHAYVAIEALPLTPNGKVDRNALPQLEERHFDRREDAIAPRTEEEMILADIWANLLGLDAVAVNDNFFHVGGDSILAIRMAARATDAGLPLTPTDVFQLQTIERLAESARAARPRQGRAASDRVFAAELVPLAASDGGTGPFLLASLMLDQAIDVVMVGMVVQRLAERHEALRLRWSRESGVSRAEIMAYVAPLPIRYVAAPALPDSQIDDWIAEHAARIGRGLDLQSGVSIAATLIDRGASAGPVVVVAIHQAVADQRTLAMIMAELETAIRTGHYAALPVDEGTATLADWLDWLAACADVQAVGHGLHALEAIATPAPILTAQSKEAPSLETAVAERWLDTATSDALMDSVPTRLAVSLLDVLAASLAPALAAPAGADGVLIEAVDGQRRLLDGAPDVERLAGNLDDVFLVLAPTNEMPLEERLRAVKEARQGVATTAPVYRILGQTFDLPAAEVGIAWSMVPGTHGSIQLHSPPTFGPSVAGKLVATAVGGQVRLSWFGAAPRDGAATVLDRVAVTLAEICELAARCARPLYTPADFPLAALDTTELERLVATADDIEDVFPLSPMQEAMLVHTVATTESEVNFEQSCMRIRGPLDHATFRHAWTTVFERHGILRTSFHWRGLSRPLQVVHREVALPLSVETWPSFDPAALDAFLAADRARGFNLAQAPLVRLTLIQVGEEDAFIVASFHHLLVDGWCLSRIEREVRAAYEAYRSRRPPLFEAPVPYRNYIAWLARADRATSRQFFGNLLRGIPDRQLTPAGGARGFTTVRRTLDRTASRALTAFARRRGLTLATTLHFAWAVWLAAHLDSDDVVFGTTVSGRPASIPGVEAIVGLFINNLPVRLKAAPDARIEDCLTTMQTILGQLQEHAHLSPASIAAAAGIEGHPGALFDSLVVVENLASGTSAWQGAEGLQVETVHSRLKTAYDLTFVAVPGEIISLSLIQSNGSPQVEDAEAALAAVAAILAELPARAHGAISDLPRPPAGPGRTPAAAVPVRFATRPRSTLEALITDLVSDQPATVAPIGRPVVADLDTDFASLGMTSLGLIQLSMRLEQRLGRSIPISLLLEHRSIASLARAIAEGQGWKPVVPMTGFGNRSQSDTSAPEPFVCVHPVAGDVSVFLDLARAMPSGIPFWAIQAAGLERGQEPLSTVEALADANLKALADMGLPRPRWIGGYSFGGIVAFEMARQLAARGTPPQSVVIIDTPAPLERSSILPSDPDRAHAEWLVRMGDVRARFQGVAPVLPLDALLKLSVGERFDFALKRLHEARLLPPAADVGWLERAHKTSLVQYAAYLAYEPDPLADRALRLALIRASAPRQSDLGELENIQLEVPDQGWQTFTDTPVAVVRVAGDHVTILNAENAQSVAEAIADLMTAQGPGTRRSIDTATFDGRRQHENGRVA